LAHIGLPQKRRQVYAGAMSDAPDGIDPRKMKAALLARQAELRALKDASAEGSSTVELDQTKVGRLSRMDALQGQQMALATARRRDAELQRIDAALQRIADGDYGWCLRCDQAIAPKRLELDPAAPYCIGCAG
jgi:DnaK suppressor protein